MGKDSNHPECKMCQVISTDSLEELDCPYPLPKEKAVKESNVQ